MMRRQGRPILWLFIGVIGLMLLSLQGVGAQDEPVFHIGVLDNERGAISNGARLAVRDINAAGGVRGADGTVFRLDLVIESSNPGFSLDQAVQNLAAQEVVAVLGPQTNDEVLNGLTQLDSLNIPVITPATDDTIITSDASGLLFRSRAQEALLGQALASYLIQEFSLTNIATVQLDISSTVSVVDFTTSAGSLGVTPQPAIVLTDSTDLDSTLSDLQQVNPAVVVAFGPPDLAASLYSGLRAQLWTGIFAYNQAFDPIFRAAVPFDELNGVISVTTWPFTAMDALSRNFLLDFVRAYGEVPGAVEAASYDSVNLIADALMLPGSLSENLANAPENQGVQGVLNAPELGEGELSNNVAVVKLGELGAPEVLARYQGNQRLPEAIPLVTVTPAPTTTPTSAPQAVTLTVNQSQNVRSGPGDNYDVLGLLNPGEQFVIIGANVDFSWVVIDFQGRQGWVQANLVTIEGDLRSVPVIPTPPTPAPLITATPSPVPQTDLIIVSAVIAPNPIVPNQNFTVNVTVGNIGNAPAGPFAVAGTFPPNNTYLIGQIQGLAPGQSSVVTLAGIASGTGTFTTSLQIDANNQVQEGTVGEQNNTYNLTYTIDIGVIRQGSATLNLGDTLDLEGNGVQGDANWNADNNSLGLKAIFGSHLGLLGNVDFNTINYQLINPSAMNRDSISRSELNVGTVVGIITADGHRGVMQVTAVSDTQLGLIFKVYNG